MRWQAARSAWCTAPTRRPTPTSATCRPTWRRRQWLDGTTSANKLISYSPHQNRSGRPPAATGSQFGGTDQAHPGVRPAQRTRRPGQAAYRRRDGRVMRGQASLRSMRQKTFDNVKQLEIWLSYSTVDTGKVDEDQVP